MGAQKGGPGRQKVLILAPVAAPPLTMMAKSNEPITIKKYANRRLYNTGTSTYVTLEDLAAMVKKGEDFVVYDAKTGEDITRSVLTQIIFEQENKEGGQNLLPITFLRQLIRFYGDSMQMLVPRYLEVSIDSLTREQEKFRNQMAQAFGVGGFGALEDQVRRNMEMFERAFAMFAPFARREGSAAEPEKKPAAEIDELKRRLNEMQKRLDSLTTGGASEQSSSEIDELKRQLGEMQRRLDLLTGPRD
jgi:polyhydroxyalkanoate synthesis repressor PhaR